MYVVKLVKSAVFSLFKLFSLAFNCSALISRKHMIRVIKTLLDSEALHKKYDMRILKGKQKHS